MLRKRSLSRCVCSSKTNCIFAVLAFLCIYAADAHSQTADFGPVFEDFLINKVGPKVPGYAVAIVTGEGSYKISSGVRRVGKGDLFDENTVFRLASVSKTFTSAAVIAMQNPKVNFDTTLVSYLPDLELSNSENQKKLTLGHVLSQTSGLMPHAYTNLIQDNVPYKNIVKSLKNVDFICEPGRCYSYQNVVYSLVGDALAQAGNSTYEQLVEKKLFNVLDMQSSSFGYVSLLEQGNRAMPHRWNKQDKRWQATEPKENYYQLSPSAGINTNLTDMVKWLEAQLGQHPEVLSDADLEVLHSPVVKTSRKQSHYVRDTWNGVSNLAYALGWRTFNFDGQTGFVHHGGWVEGFRVEMLVNRRLNMGLFFVTNSEPGLASDIVPTFIRMYLKHSNKRDTNNSL